MSIALEPAASPTLDALTLDVVHRRLSARFDEVLAKKEEGWVAVTGALLSALRDVRALMDGAR